MRLVAVATVAGVALLAGLIVLRGRTLAALLIRRRLDAGAAEMTSALRAHDPTGVAELRDERYGPAPDNLLDVYWAEHPGGAPVGPAVVWVHGGGWLANDKSDASPYYRLLAAAGFTVVAVNYSRAPRHRYPAPVRDVDAALAHLQRHASRLRIDPTRMVLAGDSAGAQIAAQVATIITNPAYAGRVGIPSAFPAEHLRGVVLNCGVYDLVPYVRGEVPRTRGLLGFVLETVLWAYTGQQDPRADVFTEMSVLRHATSDFPPTFITGGNADRLTDAQSRPLAAHLTRLGVRVDALLYLPSHEPALGHEYQFDLDAEAGQEALRRTVAFLASVTT